MRVIARINTGKRVIIDRIDDCICCECCIQKRRDCDCGAYQISETGELIEVIVDSDQFDEPIEPSVQYTDDNAWLNIVYDQIQNEYNTKSINILAMICLDDDGDTVFPVDY